MLRLAHPPEKRPHVQMAHTQHWTFFGFRNSQISFRTLKQYCTTAGANCLSPKLPFRLVGTQPLPALQPLFKAKMKCSPTNPPSYRPGREAAGPPDPTLERPPGLELAGGVVEQARILARPRAGGVLRVVLLPFLGQPQGGGGPDADGPGCRAAARRALVPTARLHRTPTARQSRQEWDSPVRHGVQVHVRDVRSQHVSTSWVISASPAAETHMAQVVLTLAHA